jgi:hypothetical protein
MTRKRLTIVLVALLSVSACSSGSAEPEPPRVASFKSPGLAPSAAPSSAAPERPRERLDTTPEEYEALLEPYNQCVRDRGAKPKSDWKSNTRPTKAMINKMVEADKYCSPRYSPLPPWEKDPANPESRDFARDVVKCLKAKGVKYVEVSDDGISIALGGDQNDSRSISMGMDLIPGCERKIAAANK